MGSERGVKGTLLLCRRKLGIFCCQKMGSECFVEGIELSQVDSHDLVVVFWAGITCRKFLPQVVTGEAMHGPATGSFLQKHLRFPPSILIYYSVRFIPAG